MALIVKVNGNNAGADVVSAVNAIRQGLSILQKLDGLRAEAIGAGATEMATIFGVADATQAQALSDRWSALLAAYEDTGNAEYAKLRDFLNAFVYLTS